METKIEIIDGNIINATDPIIGHCCNCQNLMGSGVAQALRTRFPEVYEADTKYNICGNALLGNCDVVEVVTDKELTDIKYIANLYAQFRYGKGRMVNYEALYNSLEGLRKFIRPTLINKLGLPYKLASDRAGGSWDIVLAIIKEVFKNTGITINLYRYETKNS